jgi:hypothetical protein
MDAKLVLDAVAAAFHGTVMPPATALMNDHCKECVETSRTFWDEKKSFMSWEAAADGRGQRVEAALLTPDAWRYYLPALIVWCVRDTRRVDVLVGNLVNELTPQRGIHEEWFEPRAIGFSTEQRRAVLAFLEWYQEREQAEWASVGMDPPSSVRSAIKYWRRAP